MKEKYQIFENNILGHAVEVSDSTNKFQCMDLAYSWVFCLDIPKATIQHLYAYEVFTKAGDLTREYFEIIPNTPEGIPQAGDLIIFSNKVGVAGHIAIATGKGALKQFTSLDQNWNGKQVATLTTHTYDAVLGWLRPKIKTTDVSFPGINDQTRIPQLDFMEVQAIKSKLNDQDRTINELKNRPPEQVEVIKEVIKKEFVYVNREAGPFGRIGDQLDQMFGSHGN